MECHGKNHDHKYQDCHDCQEKCHNHEADDEEEEDDDDNEYIDEFEDDSINVKVANFKLNPKFNIRM